MQIPSFSVIIISSLTAIITSIIWPNYQFHRNNKFNYKNKIRYFFTLIKESVGINTLQIKNIHNFLDSIDENTTTLPKCKKTPYPSYDFLAEKAIDEEYYSAYVRILKSIINADEYFFQLKYSAVFLQRQYASMFEIIETASEKNHVRRQKFVAQYYEIRDLFTDMYHKKSATISLMDLTYMSMNNLIATRTSENNINEIYHLFLEPVMNGIKTIQKMNDVEYNFAIKISDAIYTYKDICFQNFCIKEDVNTILPNIIVHSDHIKEVKQFLENPQMKQFF